MQHEADILICAAVYADRSAYETLSRIGFTPLDFPEGARCVIESVAEQYERDPALQSASHDTLRSQVVRRFGVGTMSDGVMDFVGQLPDNVSTVNVLEEYRLLRLARCSTELATLLASGDHGEATEEALAVYKQLVAGEKSEEVIDRLSFEDFEDDNALRLPIYPASLNAYVGGGLLRGHTMILYGRPNSGKSLFALNLAACAIRDGRKVVYVANEEPDFTLTRRLLARLTGASMESLCDSESLRHAFRTAKEWYKNWYLYYKPGVTIRDIRRYVARVNPDYIIVDQLKNVSTRDDHRALQLDFLAQQVREIGIEFKAVTISVTQAGDSAEQKLVLAMNDVEWSNTGIPGAADLMVGIGVNDQILTSGKRILSICKNKANGKHGSFPVWMDSRTTKITSQIKV